MADLELTIGKDRAPNEAQTKDSVETRYERSLLANGDFPSDFTSSLSFTAPHDTTYPSRRTKLHSTEIITQEIKNCDTCQNGTGWDDLFNSIGLGDSSDMTKSLFLLGVTCAISGVVQYALHAPFTAELIRDLGLLAIGSLTSRVDHQHKAHGRESNLTPDQIDSAT